MSREIAVINTLVITTPKNMKLKRNEKNAIDAVTRLKNKLIKKDRQEISCVLSENG